MRWTVFDKQNDTNRVLRDGDIVVDGAKVVQLDLSGEYPLWEDISNTADAYEAIKALRFLQNLGVAKSPPRRRVDSTMDDISLAVEFNTDLKHYSMGGA